MNFSNFILWAVYPIMEIHHEQWIFTIYNSADRERNNSQQLSKLIELKLMKTKINENLSGEFKNV